jgi:hypothetical protein
MVPRLSLTRHRWREIQTLTAPDSIPVDQLQGSDDITGGGYWEGLWPSIALRSCRIGEPLPYGRGSDQSPERQKL